VLRLAACPLAETVCDAPVAAVRVSTFASQASWGGQGRDQGWAGAAGGCRQPPQICHFPVDDPVGEAHDEVVRSKEGVMTDMTPPDY
jgi:hypothetical protein